MAELISVESANCQTLGIRAHGTVVCLCIIITNLPVQLDGAGEQ